MSAEIAGNNEYWLYYQGIPLPFPWKSVEEYGRIAVWIEVSRECDLVLSFNQIYADFSTSSAVAEGKENKPAGRIQQNKRPYHTYMCTNIYPSAIVDLHRTEIMYQVENRCVCVNLALRKLRS